MRKTLAATVTALAIGAFATPAIAGPGCGGARTADRDGSEVASAEQSHKPVQQSQISSKDAE